MMSEMKEDVRVMVMKKGSGVALADKPRQPHVACLTFSLTLLLLMTERWLIPSHRISQEMRFSHRCEALFTVLFWIDNSGK